MIARILEDERYLGKEEFPAILNDEVFRQADEKRRKKQLPSQLTETQKVLRRLSGQKVGNKIERQVLEWLNILIENPEVIQQPPSITAQHRATKLESDLEMLLETQPVDEDTARQLILQIAAEKYETVPSEEYETRRLRNIFTRTEKMERLDSELLKSTISEIKISGDSIAIRLKNSQISFKGKNHRISAGRDTDRAEDLRIRNQHSREKSDSPVGYRFFLCHAE